MVKDDSGSETLSWTTLSDYCCLLLTFLVFNMHIQSKLLKHTPVMGTHSSYQLGCLSRTDVSS